VRKRWPEAGRWPGVDPAGKERGAVNGDQEKWFTALQRRIGGLFHRHAATETAAMTHIAIVETLDDKSADWMEHVSDAQYQA
jgi:hypothetical protein